MDEIGVMRFRIKDVTVNKLRRALLEKKSDVKISDVLFKFRTLFISLRTNFGQKCRTLMLKHS